MITFDDIGEIFQAVPIDVRSESGDACSEDKCNQAACVSYAPSAEDRDYRLAFCKDHAMVQPEQYFAYDVFFTRTGFGADHPERRVVTVAARCPQEAAVLYEGLVSESDFCSSWDIVHDRAESSESAIYDVHVVSRELSTKESYIHGLFMAAMQTPSIGDWYDEIDNTDNVLSKSTQPIQI